MPIRTDMPDNRFSDALVLWRDRRGRLSPVRIATLAVLVWPAVLIAIDYGRGGLGGRPLNEVIHRTGWWALMFLLVSLAITPLRRSTRLAKLIDVRRMIGVASFAYAAAHLTLFVADQRFDLVKVATEIVSRLYLTIGFVALLGLTILAATSNDTMVKRLGGLRWRQLHQITFGITLLALVHYFQQTKADVSVPAAYAAMFAWLVGYRVLARRIGDDALTPAAIVLLTLVVSALTFVGEAVGIAIAFKQPILPFVGQFLGTVFDLSLGIRPGWWVLGIGLAVAAIDAVRGLMERRASARPVPAPPARAEPVRAR